MRFSHRVPERIGDEDRDMSDLGRQLLSKR